MSYAWLNASLTIDQNGACSLGSCVVSAKIMLLLPRSKVYNELPLDTREYENHSVQHNEIRICSACDSAAFHCYCVLLACVITAYAKAVNNTTL